MNQFNFFLFRIVIYCFVFSFFSTPTTYIEASGSANFGMENKTKSEIWKLDQEARKLDIESKKLLEETEKIRREKNSLFWSPILQFITSVIGICSLIITYFASSKAHRNTINSLRIQSEKNETDRISSLLKELGSENISVRIGAVQALGEYEVSIRYLINVLKFDNVPAVREAAVLALHKFPDQTIPVLAEESRILHDTQMKFAANHFFYNMDKNQIITLFMINEQEWNNWYKRFYIKFKEEKIRQILVERFTENISEYTIRKRDLEEIKNEWKKCYSAIKELVCAMEKIIWARKSCKENKMADELRINNAYLPGLILEQKAMENIVFENCILNRSSFKGTTLKKIQFSKCDLSDTSFINANIADSLMINCKVDRTRLSTSSLNKLLFDKCEGSEIRFNGAKLNYVNFNNCILINSHFHGLNANYVAFSNDTRFYNCNFGGKWIKLNIYDSNFGGGKFDKMQVYEGSFMNLTSKGLKWDSGKFESISFKHCLFEKNSVTESMAFERITLFNCEFKHETNELMNYLNSAVERPKNNKWWSFLSSNRYSPPR